MHLHQTPRTPASTVVTFGDRYAYNTVTGQAMEISQCLLIPSPQKPGLFLAQLLGTESGAVLVKLPEVFAPPVDELTRSRGIVLAYRDELRNLIDERDRKLLGELLSDSPVELEQDFINLGGTVRRATNTVSFDALPTALYIQVSWQPRMFIRPW